MATDPNASLLGYERRLRRFLPGDKIPARAEYQAVMREGDETAIYYIVQEVSGWIEEIPPTPREKKGWRL